MPQAERAAHIVPGLVHMSLVLIKMLIDAGCKVTYDTKRVKLFYKGNVVWKGTRESLTGLWVLPLKQTGKIAQPRTLNIDKNTANNAYQMTQKEELIRYLHQCLFPPTKLTLLKAIKIINWQHGQASQKKQSKNTSHIHAQQQIKGT